MYRSFVDVADSLGLGLDFRVLDDAVVAIEVNKIRSGSGVVGLAVLRSFWDFEIRKNTPGIRAAAVKRREFQLAELKSALDL